MQTSEDLCLKDRTCCGRSVLSEDPPCFGPQALSWKEEVLLLAGCCAVFRVFFTDYLSNPQGYFPRYELRLAVFLHEGV